MFLNLPIKMILTLALLVPAPAFAADLFIKRNTDKDELMELRGDDAPMQQEEEQAPPRTINDFANAYYKSCMQKEHPLLKADDKEMLCGCTSANIPGNMTVEQMQAMQTDTAEGQDQRNRMMLFVYTPCIEYPTRALVLDQCMNNKQVQSSMRNFREVCSCLADSMAVFMKENASQAVQAAVRRNRKDYDPLSELLQSRKYENHTQLHMKKCVTKHELGRSR